MGEALSASLLASRLPICDAATVAIHKWKRNRGPQLGSSQSRWERPVRCPGDIASAEFVWQQKATLSASPPPWFRRVWMPRTVMP